MFQAIVATLLFAAAGEVGIRDAIAAARATNAWPGAATVTVLDEADVRVEASGLALTEARRVVLIRTPEGARAEAVQRLRFDPAVNRAAFDGVTLHRKDGRREAVPLDRAVAQPSPQSSLFWGGTTLSLPVPRLEPGDALEIRTSRIGYNIAYLAGEGLSGDGLVPPMDGQWFEVERFFATAPVQRKRYSVHIPVAMNLQYAVHGGAIRVSRRVQGDRETLTFEAEDLPPLKREPSAVSPDDFAPKVVLATVADWPAKSRWFEAVNRGQFEADDAIRAKVAELTADLPDDEARIAALLHWVADHIRYCGTSRGPREGYTLHRGIETFRDRAGVCKDIAGMLITMLRAAGFPAWPALTMAGSRVEDVPADQFNHTVVALRRTDGSFRFLDPTWSPCSRELWSSREALQGVVPGTPEGEGLMLSPHFPPEANEVRAVSEASLDAKGTLRTTVSMDLSGYPCTYWRRNRNGRPPAERASAAREALGIAPNASLSRLADTDPFDYTRDSAVGFEVTAEGFAAGSDPLVFRLPLLRHPFGRWLVPDILEVPPDGGREQPFRLRATRRIRYDETIGLPPGWTAAAIPPDVKIEEKAASLAFAAKAEGNRLRYSFELSVHLQTVPAADVAGLRKVLLAARDLSEALVAIRSGEGR